MAILIQGGKLVDPVRNRVEEQDLLIEGERIAKILPERGLTRKQGPVSEKSMHETAWWCLAWWICMFT